MDSANITTNKNSIPFDNSGPFDPNGLRIGTPAVTSRGMKEEDMRTIARLIAMTIKHKDQVQAEVKATVKELVMKYPLYKGKFKL